MEETSKHMLIDKITASYVGSVDDICKIFDLILESNPAKSTSQQHLNLRRIVMIVLLCCGVQRNDMLDIQNSDIFEKQVIVKGKKIELPSVFQKYIKEYKKHSNYLSYRSDYLCENINGNKITSHSQLCMFLHNTTIAMNYFTKGYDYCSVKNISILALVRSYCFCQVLTATKEKSIQGLIFLLKQYCSSSYAFYKDTESNIDNIYNLYNKWVLFFHKQDYRPEVKIQKEVNPKKLTDFKLVTLDRSVGGMFAKFDEISVLYYELGSENSLTSDINYISSFKNTLKLLYLQTPFDDMDLSSQHSNGELVITLNFSSFVLSKKEIDLFLSLAELCEISIYNNQNNIIVSCLVRVSEGNQAKQEVNKNTISLINNNSLVVESKELDTDFICSQRRESKIPILCEIMKIKSEDIFVLSNTKKKIFDIYFTQLTDEAQLSLLEAVLVSDLFELKTTLDNRWCCHFEINI